MVFDARKANKLAKAQQAAFTSWSRERARAEEDLDIAQTFSGVTTTDHLMLKPGEAVFLEVGSSGLVEARRGPGEWKGRSQGISVPVGSVAGHNVRYRVGANKGHYTQGAEKPTVIDTGTLVITNQRAVFVGTKQTRECLYAKLVSYDHTSGATTFSVSNRQKPTTVAYGDEAGPTVRFRIELAIAHFRQDEGSLVRQLEADLAAIDAREPVHEVGGEDVQAKAPDWYPDPSRRHEVRYFDGTVWSAHVADAGVQASDPFGDWYPDPSSAHELRYYDGTAWTDHVADGGTQSTDPLAQSDAEQDGASSPETTSASEAQSLGQPVVEGESVEKGAELAPSGRDEGSTPESVTVPPPDLFDQLRKLAGLRDDGILTEEEFQEQKARLLR